MPKKQSLRQIEKRQREKKGKKEEKGGRFVKTIGALDIPDMSSEELMDRLKRIKAITPTGLAIQFNIKVSMTKRLLEELQEQRSSPWPPGATTCARTAEATDSSSLKTAGMMFSCIILG